MKRLGREYVWPHIRKLFNEPSFREELKVKMKEKREENLNRCARTFWETNNWVNNFGEIVEGLWTVSSNKKVPVCIIKKSFSVLPYGFCRLLWAQFQTNKEIYCNKMFLRWKRVILKMERDASSYLVTVEFEIAGEIKTSKKLIDSCCSIPKSTKQFSPFILSNSNCYQI